MAELKPIQITNFTGQVENPHLGFGAAVGIDLYTTKGVARLSRKMTKKSGNTVTGLPIYVTQDNDGVIYCMDETGVIYLSDDSGISWNILTGNSGDDGKGIIVWNDYLFSFVETDIDVYGPLSGTPTWINGWWTDSNGANQSALNSSIHLPIINPGNGNLIFCNREYVGIIVKAQRTVPFDPTDDTTFYVDGQGFELASMYTCINLGFLPPGNIAIAVQNKQNNTQADIVTWDGVSTISATNVISIPGASGYVKQLVSRNGILYAVTNYEHGIYTVNGTSAENIDRLSLRMSNRKVDGEQYTTRLWSYIHPQACDFLGPELLTGGTNNPAAISELDDTGLYPFGVWSVNVEDNTIGTKFPLSFGDITADYGTAYEIGLIKVIDNGSVIVGWRKGSEYGIDTLDADEYITDSTTVFLESEYFEVGTRTEPVTYNQVEYNLVTPLLGGQEIEFFYRTNQVDPYTSFATITENILGTNTSGIITPLPFQSYQYIQIAVSMKTLGTGDVSKQTPQLRSILLR